MAYIRHIETLVPPTSYSQPEVALFMRGMIDDRTARRYIEQIYADCGIEKRHSVIQNLCSTSGDGFYGLNKEFELLIPSTGGRNDLYANECSRLGNEVSRAALTNCEGISCSQITHLITVSCTGFYSPGVDYGIVQHLGLRPTVQRYHLGFMGCYAALPALRMAHQFCEADPHAVVLVVCIELCTLHLKLGTDLDSIISNSLFADGAAAAIISATPAPDNKRCYKLDLFASTLIPEGEDQMAWRIGDTGFDMVLTRYVPRLIEANISGFISAILNNHQIKYDDLGFWAIHPGGKSILDAVQRKLSLSQAQMRYSREIMRQYGNMSSVTILFVLQMILQQQEASNQSNVFAMAFGPGLTVETALLEIQPRLPATIQPPLKVGIDLTGPSIEEAWVR